MTAVASDSVKGKSLPLSVFTNYSSLYFCAVEEGHASKRSLWGMKENYLITRNLFQIGTISRL